jgi:hypothetical protein
VLRSKQSVRKGVFLIPNIMQTIISVNEAKKILGKTGRDYSDDQIIEIIGILSLLAKNQLTK